MKVTAQHPLKFEVFLYNIYSKCSGLSHLCLVQGEKTEFSGLNTSYILYCAPWAILRMFKFFPEEFVNIFNDDKYVWNIFE